MPQSVAAGHVLPAGTLPKVKLSGAELQIEIAQIRPENGFTADGSPVPSENTVVVVKYPDGFVKHHQSNDIGDLIKKITNTLKARYNVVSFEFAAPPLFVEGHKIILTEVQYS